MYVRIEDEEGYLGRISMFAFARNEIGEPRNAGRLEEMVKTCQRPSRSGTKLGSN